MKTRNWLIITIIAAVSLGLVSTPTWAGSKQRYRWEGVAIGFGAAMVGCALINNCGCGYCAGPPVALSFSYRESYRHPSKHHGNWKGYHRGPNNRGQHYRGHSRHGNSYGNTHRNSWKNHGPGASGGKGSHRRGHGG